MHIQTLVCIVQLFYQKSLPMMLAAKICCIKTEISMTNYVEPIIFYHNDLKTTQALVDSVISVISVLLEYFE